MKEEIQKAIDVVLSFANVMNDWETRRFYRSRVDTGYEFTFEHDKELAGELSAEELDQEYLHHFQNYCTSKNRKYSAFPSSYCAGGKYAGISEKTIRRVEEVKPNRIEIVCTGGDFPEQQYKFILFKKSNVWLIDNAYIRFRDEDEWIKHHL